MIRKLQLKNYHSAFPVWATQSRMAPMIPPDNTDIQHFSNLNHAYKNCAIEAITSLGIWENPNWNIGTLEPGESGTLNISVEIDIDTRNTKVNCC